MENLPEVQSKVLEDVVAVANTVNAWLRETITEAYAIGQNPANYVLPVKNDKGEVIGTKPMSQEQIEAFQHGLGSAAILFTESPLQVVPNDND